MGVMQRHAPVVFQLGMFFTLATGLPSLAQSPAPKGRPRPIAGSIPDNRQRNDPVVELMRREALARRNQQDHIFAKLRALNAVPAPAVARAQAIRLVRVEAVPLLRGNVAADPQRVRQRIRLFARMDGLEFLLEEPEPEPPRVADEGEDEGDGPDEIEVRGRVFRPRRLDQFVVARESYDQWIFGRSTKAQHNIKLMELLRSNIARASLQFQLTPVQEEKLRLAGRGDIKRFFDQVEEKRQEFERSRTDFRRCQAFARELGPLRLASKNGPLGEGSLFAKTLKKMLAEQPRVPFRVP
jgi:hypothetical protein